MNSKGFLFIVAAIVVLLVIAGLLVGSGIVEEEVPPIDEPEIEEEPQSPTDGELPNGELQNCVSGPQVAPKTSFVWQWDQIGSNFCDTDNPEGVFCDGAQFMVAFVEKLESIESDSQTSQNPFENWQVFMKRVNFSSDWKSDFLDYYSNKDLTASSFFKTEFADKLDSANLVINPTNLNQPGTYKVMVENPSSDQAVQTTIEFELVRGIEDDAFNWIPFEGLLGQTDSGAFDRQNYGAQFFAPKKILLSESFSLNAETESTDGRYPFILNIDERAKNLNVQPDKGNLLTLTLNKSDNLFATAELFFSPTLADPILMKGVSQEFGSDRVEFRYNAFEGATQITGPGELIEWSPVGQCADFAGENKQKNDVWNASPPYRKVQFNRSTQNNATFLQTVFYSPTSTHSSESHLSAMGVFDGRQVKEDALGFVDESQNNSVQTPSKNLPLNGVAGMLYNTPSDKIRFIEQVFELVKEGLACIKTTQTETQLKQEFKWVEEKLFDEISEELEQAQQQCGALPLTTIREGEIIDELNGAGAFACEKVSLKLEAISAIGPATTNYNAKFVLIDAQGNEIDEFTAMTGDSLNEEFEDSQGNTALLDAIVVESIGVAEQSGIGEAQLTIIKQSDCQTEQSPNVGAQKTAVILVKFSDMMETTKEPEIYQQAIFDAPNSVSEFYREVSYGKAWLEGSVFGWYEIEEDSQCDQSFILTKTIEAAEEDIYFPDYKRIIIIYPQTRNFETCKYSAGNSTIGAIEIDTADGPVNTSVVQVIWEGYVNLLNEIASFTIAHELAHSFGVWHANSYECGQKVIDDRYLVCEANEYENPFELHGQGIFSLHQNAFFKRKIGWLNDSQFVRVIQSGNYVIYPLEVSDSKPKALVLSINPQISIFNGLNKPTIPVNEYYIEYRKPIGFDEGLSTVTDDDGLLVLYGPASFNPGFNEGKLFNQDRDSWSTYLFDPTPESNTFEEGEIDGVPYGFNLDFLDAFIGLGDTFQDEYNDLTIKPLRFTNDGGIEIQVMFEGQPLPQAPPQTTTESIEDTLGQVSSQINEILEALE